LHSGLSGSISLLFELGERSNTLLKLKKLQILGFKSFCDR